MVQWRYATFQFPSQPRGGNGAIRCQSCFPMVIRQQRKSCQEQCHPSGIVAGGADHHCRSCLVTYNEFTLHHFKCMA